jgi:hypothetical protein
LVGNLTAIHKNNASLAIANVGSLKYMAISLAIDQRHAHLVIANIASIVNIANIGKALVGTNVTGNSPQAHTHINCQPYNVLGLWQCHWQLTKMVLPWPMPMLEV